MWSEWATAQLTHARGSGHFGEKLAGVHPLISVAYYSVATEAAATGEITHAAPHRSIHSNVVFAAFLKAKAVCVWMGAHSRKRRGETAELVNSTRGGLAEHCLSEALQRHVSTKECYSESR